MDEGTNEGVVVDDSAVGRWLAQLLGRESGSKVARAMPVEDAPKAADPIEDAIPADGGRA